MSDQFREDRLNKLRKLQDLGVNAYGERTQGIQSTTDIHQQLEKLDLEAGEISETACGRVAGRIMLLRSMGKLVFLTLRDRRGDLQLGLTKKFLEAHWPMMR